MERHGQLMVSNDDDDGVSFQSNQQTAVYCVVSGKVQSWRKGITLAITRLSNLGIIII